MESTLNNRLDQFGSLLDQLFEALKDEATVLNGHKEFISTIPAHNTSNGHKEFISTIPAHTSNGHKEFISTIPVQKLFPSDYMLAGDLVDETELSDTGSVPAQSDNSAPVTQQEVAIIMAHPVAVAGGGQLQYSATGSREKGSDGKVQSDKHIIWEPGDKEKSAPYRSSALGEDLLHHLTQLTQFVRKREYTRGLLDVAALILLSKLSIATSGTVKVPLSAMMCFDPGIVSQVEQDCGFISVTVSNVSLGSSEQDIKELLPTWDDNAVCVILKAVLRAVWLGALALLHQETCFGTKVVNTLLVGCRLTGLPTPFQYLVAKDLLVRLQCLQCYQGLMKTESAICSGHGTLDLCMTAVASYYIGGESHGVATYYISPKDTKSGPSFLLHAGIRVKGSTSLSHPGVLGLRLVCGVAELLQKEFLVECVVFVGNISGQFAFVMHFCFDPGILQIRSVWQLHGLVTMGTTGIIKNSVTLIQCLVHIHTPPVSSDDSVVWVFRPALVMVSGLISYETDGVGTDMLIVDLATKRQSSVTIDGMESFLTVSRGISISLVILQWLIAWDISSHSCGPSAFQWQRDIIWLYYGIVLMKTTILVKQQGQRLSLISSGTTIIQSSNKSVYVSMYGWDCNLRVKATLGPQLTPSRWLLSEVQVLHITMIKKDPTANVFSYSFVVVIRVLLSLHKRYESVTFFSCCSTHRMGVSIYVWRFNLDIHKIIVAFSYLGCSKLFQGKSYCGGRVSGLLIIYAVPLRIEPTVPNVSQLLRMTQACFHQYLQFMRGVYFLVTGFARQLTQGYIICYDPGIEKLCLGHIGRVMVWTNLKLFTTQEGSNCYALGIEWLSISYGSVEQWSAMSGLSVLFQALGLAISSSGCVQLSHGTCTMVAALWRIAWTSPFISGIYFYLPHLDP
ncbi:hypothetical protein ACHQM5_024023 [Ranunculus cassubicifolius]